MAEVRVLQLGELEGILRGHGLPVVHAGIPNFQDGIALPRSKRRSDRHEDPSGPCDKYTLLLGQAEGALEADGTVYHTHIRLCSLQRQKSGNRLER